MTITWHEIQEIFTSIQDAGDVYGPGQCKTLLEHIKDDITLSSGSRKLWEILLNPENIGGNATTKDTVFTFNQFNKD